jgi:hypothetical protein
VALIPVLQAVHADITRRALATAVSRQALEAVIAANVRVDDLWNQLGHDELHFDNNAFYRSRAHMEAQRARLVAALQRGEAPAAWQAFGRLTHTAQDFYAHSNYVDLWLSCQPQGMVPAPAEIDPLDDALIENPALRSGKSYLPFGALSFAPILGPFILPVMPRDSHARMNLDSAERGPMFQYAFHAAIKRTRHEYEIITRNLAEPLRTRFLGFPEARPVSDAVN